MTATRPNVQIDIVTATAEHAHRLAPRVRAVDSDEIRAAGNWSPLGALLAGVSLSRPARAALFNGTVACLYGVTPLRTSFLSGRTGAAWLIASDLIERYPVAFFRQCRPALLELFESYDTLINAIDVRHDQAVRWGRRLGFRLEDAEAFGPEGLPFHRFRFEREDLHV